MYIINIINLFSVIIYLLISKFNIYNSLNILNINNIRKSTKFIFCGKSGNRHIYYLLRFLLGVGFCC